MPLVDFIWKGSPNFGYPTGTHGQLGRHRWGKVLHITGPGTLAGMDSWFGNPNSGASAHIGLNGREDPHQYVDFGDAAWHAGLLNRPDTSNPVVQRFVTEGLNPNLYELGIEVVAEPGDDLAREAWDQLVAVNAELDRRFPELADTPEAHLGHHQLDSVNRSRDPVSVYQPRDVWRRHHMAELTDEQKGQLVQASLLPTAAEIEGFAAAFDLRDTAILNGLKDGDLQAMADQAAAYRRGLDQSVPQLQAKLAALLAKLRFYGILPNR